MSKKELISIRVSISPKTMERLEIKRVKSKKKKQDFYGNLLDQEAKGVVKS